MASIHMEANVFSEHRDWRGLKHHQIGKTGVLELPASRLLLWTFAPPLSKWCRVSSCRSLYRNECITQACHFKNPGMPCRRAAAYLLILCNFEERHPVVRPISLRA